MSTSLRAPTALTPALSSLPDQIATSGRRSEVAVLAAYTATMFVSATLLFLVQPMFARMVLPLLGGSPAVWNTTVVFYQAVLLGGYVYAHLATARLGVRRQAALHVVLLLLPFLVLPISVPGGWSPPAADNPIPWLLMLLSITVGLPFFVVSTSSPMLQRWFVATGHPSGRDPYFLYAASNVGSLLALLAYPLLAEPNLRLSEQSWLWMLGYGLLVLLTLACAGLVWRSPLGLPVARVSPETTMAAPTERLSGARRLRWVVLAFVPSSLMLSVTTYLSNNVVPIPLLWVVPLALYLLTFILVFASRPLIPHLAMVRALPIVLLPLVVVMAVEATQPIWLLISLHVAAFFVAAMVCHRALAADRPAPRHLTEFYLWMSLGGVLGGMFNALAAPLLFSSVLEYPLVMILACAIQRAPAKTSPRPAARYLDVVLPLGLAALVALLVAVADRSGLRSGPLSIVLVFLLPALLCFSFSRRPLRFGLGIAALFLAGGLYASLQGGLLYAERSFFGIHRVLVDPNGRYHLLSNGGTLHGMQSLDPALRMEPLTYFTASGPAGQLLGRLNERGSARRVAVVGLGAGTLACHARPDQEWTFYEIDPAVERIARDPKLFTYLRDCAPTAPVVLGDARLSLANAPDGHYDVLVLDAYTSDSPPIHLLTREALALFTRKLSPNGIIAFHISNGFLRFDAVLGKLADDAGLTGLVQHDLIVSDDEAARGKKPSQWALMARKQDSLQPLAADRRWKPLTAPADAPLWTDDFTSILSVLRPY